MNDTLKGGMRYESLFHFYYLIIQWQLYKFHLTLGKLESV